MPTLDDIRAHDNARAFRSAEIGAIDVEARTVALAFSSEAEVQRWYGIEILSHEPGAMMTARLLDGAPLLLEHDREWQIGVVQSISIDTDRRGRAVVRFGKSARADEIFQDIVDGIRRHVSVGYRVHDAERVEVRDDDDVWRITQWEPFEISIVSVPADTSVGVGRNDENAAPHPAAPIDSTKERTMSTKVNGAQDEGVETKESSATAAAPDTDASATRGADAERARARSIIEMGRLYRATELAATAVANGTSAAEFQRQLLEHVASRKQEPLSEQVRAADIGMSEREVRNYSILRVVRALVDPTSRAAQEAAAFEFEASRAAAELAGKNPEGVMIPSDVLSRALNTGTAGSGQGDTGGHLIANTLLASSFIDLLRNRSTILRLGLTLGGLVGNLDIPKQVSGAQGYWVGENEDANEGTQVYGQVPVSPKTVAAYSEITRRMLRQSSLDVEALVRADLAAELALTIDLAGYYGTGADKQPRGISKYTGINAVSFTAEQPTFAELVAMETEIAVDNADVASMAYVANARFRGHAKTALKHDGVAGTLWEQGGTVNGYRTEITNQVAKGDVFMGNFADLIVAMWGTLEINVDPYSNSKSGALRIIAFQDVDFALRRTESFCLGRKAA